MTKYMLIDMTTVEQTRVVAVAEMRAVQLMGHVLKAQGRNVIAPPVEGRSFSKLERLPLQYLYWNVSQQVPSEDYAELLQKAFAAVDALPLDTTPLADLERMAAAVAPQPQGEEQGEAKPKRETPKHEPGTAYERPKATSTTGLVWVLADEALNEVAAGVGIDHLDWKPVRAKLMEKCEFEGINSATAATQYSKWKASKIAAAKG